ncbi:MAG: FtsX-like permease family protein [Gammaproteobacteria bacterium]|nr:FtsX-like permease family protein [Gammaproteobacteria bacterium]
MKHAVRQLCRNPGFTAVAVLTLALGIGANTATFSIVNGVVLKPLPYPEPDRLVTLWESDPARNVDQERVSGPNYLDWSSQNTVFSDMAVSPGWAGSETFNLVLTDGVAKVSGVFASSSWFTTLGVKPLLGRALLPDEDQKERSRAVVLSEELWRRQFHGDPAVLGQSLTLDTYGRRDYTIVGVMPAGFGFPGQIDLWLPLGWMDVSLEERRSAHWHNVIARLKPGVTPARAQAELNLIQARIQQAHPGEKISPRVSVVPLLQQAVGSNFRTALFILWGVVAGVLLIACANVANLLLARAATRQKEIAVRLALGAGRARIIRQLLGESILLALLGGVAALILGHWALQLLIAASPANIPRLASVSLDGTALLFTFAASLLTGVVFGLAPAWQSSRPDLNDVLKDAGRGSSAGLSARLTRHALVIAEVALAIILLAGAGLMLQSLRSLLATDRGFRPEQVLTAQLDFSVSGFTTWARPAATRPQVRLAELLQSVRQLPGVQSAGAAYRLVRPDNHPPAQSFAIFGRPAVPESERPVVEANALSPGFIRAFGVNLLRGRDFTEADTLEAPGVVFVNETFARRFFPNENPVGQFLTQVANPGPLGSTDRFGVPIWYEIVGVIGDVLSLGFPPQAVPEIYHTWWQYPMQSPTLVIRATGDPSALAAAIQRETKNIIPNLPPPEIRLMTDRVQESLAQPRFQSGLLTLFATLALLLAACGLYGLLAYAVTQRRRELGIRMALGARRNSIIALVLGQGMKLVLAGWLLGLLAALALTRLIKTLLYGVTPGDPLTLAAASLVLLLSALLACLVPARRAARVNPMEALRTE